MRLEQRTSERRARGSNVDMSWRAEGGGEGEGDEGLTTFTTFFGLNSNALKFTQTKQEGSGKMAL